MPDGLWQRIEPLLPKPVPRDPRRPGRKPIPDRQVLSGILFVLHTGIQWEFLPVRREALCDRVEVRDLRRGPVAAGR